MPQPTRAEQWLTTQQAADLAEVSRPFITKLCKAQTLTHRMVGNRHRVERSSLERWLVDSVVHAGETSDDG